MESGHNQKPACLAHGNPEPRAYLDYVLTRTSDHKIILIDEFPPRRVVNNLQTPASLSNSVGPPATLILWHFARPHE